jgi:hypothetical protein
MVLRLPQADVSTLVPVLQGTLQLGSDLEGGIRKLV